MLPDVIFIVSLHAQLGSPFQITALPPTGHGREVMGRRHRNSIRTPTLWFAEALAITLEPQDTHAGEPGVAKPFVKAVRQCAKILADDDGPMASGLKSDQAEHIVEGKADIGALGGRHPAWHDP